MTYSINILERELKGLLLQLVCDKQSVEIAERHLAVNKPTQKRVKHHERMVADLKHTQAAVDDVTRALLLLRSGL